MANNSIYFENSSSGKKKDAPVGFSWTTLFFGPFPLLFRGSVKWFAIILLGALVTFGASNLVFMFLINKLYIKDLIAAGYKAKGVKSGTLDEVAKSLELAL